MKVNVQPSEQARQRVSNPKIEVPKPDWAPESNKKWNRMNDSKKWNSTVACKGCGQKFQSIKFTPQVEIAYFHHCFDECPKFEKLNLIKRCLQCNKRFLNESALAQHCQTTGHEEPETTKKKYNVCEGCGQEFRNDSQAMKKFALHCIEYCEKYRKLGLIAPCTECHELFRNQYSLSHHYRFCRLKVKVSSIEEVKIKSE